MIDARYLQRRISQKLLFAKQLLNLGETEAIREAVASHLAVAYSAWLAEIVNDRHHPLNDAEGETAQQMAATTSQHIPAVLAECVELEKRNDSWVSLVLASSKIAQDIVNKPPPRVRPGQIALSVVDTGPTLASHEQLCDALAQFESVLDRYRESMQEF